MEQLTFHFNNNIYKATLFCSRDQRPYFYWCYFEDKEIIQKIGDCIGFKEKSGIVMPTENFSNDLQTVVNEIKQYIVGLYYQQWKISS